MSNTCGLYINIIPRFKFVQARNNSTTRFPIQESFWRSNAVRILRTIRKHTKIMNYSIPFLLLCQKNPYSIIILQNRYKRHRGPSLKAVMSALGNQPRNPGPGFPAPGFRTSDSIPGIPLLFPD